MLALLVLAMLSMAAFAAGELSLNGSVLFTLKYDGNQLTGHQYLRLDTAIKGSSVRIIFGDSSSGNWKNIPLWGSWPLANDFKMAPYRISIDVKGAWLPKGPKVTTTFGDFNSNLPLYVLGQYNRNHIAGIKVADIPVTDKVSALAFFGWPKYGAGHTILGANPQNFYNTGFKLTAKDLIPGMTLDVYGISHHHREDSIGLITYDTNKTQVTKLNAARGADEIVVFTPGVVPGTNPWGYEMLVNTKTNKVVKMADNVTAAGEAVPADHVVVSGHGAMSAWIQNNFAVDASAKVDTIFKSTGEFTTGLEATGAVSGVNYTARVLGRVPYKVSNDGKDITPVQIGTTLDANYTLKADAVTTKFTAGFRMIDKDLAPFGRRVSDDGYWNPIDSRRGQIGGNAGVNLTLPAKNVLDVTADYYRKEADKFDNLSGTVTLTNSNFFKVTAVAKATGNMKIEETKTTNTLTTNASLAKDFRLPNRDVINSKYEFSTSDLIDKKVEEITFTNKLTLKSTLTLPVVNKVTVEAIGTLVTLGDKTTPSISGKVNYTFANNVALEAKATKTSNHKTVWYTQIQYASPSW